MKKTYLFLLILAGSLFIACTQTSPGEIIKSEKNRIFAQNLNETDLAALVNGNNIFATSLYQQLKGKESNLFYSPYSISLALAMVYAGARNETEKQIASTFHFTLPQDKLHQTFNGLDTALNSRGADAKGKDGEPFRLHVVNAIWGQKNYTFLQQFLDTLAENYGAGLRLLDYISAPEESRIKINDWVSDQTEDKIKDLIPQGAITPLTRLVLTNAIYFNAAWQFPFQKNSTQKEPFFLLNGSKISVEMMRESARLGYSRGNDYQAIEMPYDSNELSMIILLPDSGKFKTFEDTLNTQILDSTIKSLKPSQVILSFPKFKFESSFNLNKVLSAMGMPLAFSPTNADFSGITGKRDLFISDVVHKSFVAVDEAGTEAAAATGVVMGTTSMPATPVTVVVDRPFIFLIRDINTGTIVFLGNLVNPVSN